MVESYLKRLLGKKKREKEREFQEWRSRQSEERSNYWKRSRPPPVDDEKYDEIEQELREIGIEITGMAPQRTGWLSHMLDQDEADMVFDPRKPVVPRLNPAIDQTLTKKMRITIYLEKGDEFRKLGDVDSARNCFLSAIEVDNKNFLAVRKLAELEYESMNWQEAAELYRILVKRYPDYRMAWMRLGRSCLEEGVYWKARQAYDTAYTIPVEDRKDGIDPFTSLPRSQMSDMTYWTQAVELMPDSADAWINLGAQFSKNGDYEKALECLDRVLEDDPNSITAHYNKAVCLHRMGHQEQAVDHFERVLQSEVDDPDIYLQSCYNLGLIHMGNERFEEARFHFKSVLEIDPGHTKAILNLGVIELSSGNSDRGREHFKHLVDMGADDTILSVVFYHLGSMMKRSRENRTARKFFRESIRRNPRLIDSWDALIELDDGNKEADHPSSFALTKNIK